MSDDHEEPPLCDWCDRDAKRRSLVMGYAQGNEFGAKWGKGDLICGACLRERKPKLYAVRYSGRQIFCSIAYYEQYWKEEDRAKVLRTPEDHRKQVAGQGSKKKRVKESADAPAEIASSKRRKSESPSD